LTDCVFICADGALATMGTKKGFNSFVKK